MDGDVRERYVGPLIDVAETYLKLRTEAGGLRGDPLMRPPGFEPGTSGLEGQRPDPG